MAITLKKATREDIKRISPIWSIGEFRNKGYAQQAIVGLEVLWSSFFVTLLAKKYLY